MNLPTQTITATLATEPTVASERPTRVHYYVVGMAVLLGMVTYLDRVSISTLAPQIQADLGIEKSTMSYVFSAFALSYMLFGVAAAWWTDRVGTRKALTQIVVWWSIFTMVTATARNLTSMLVVRFLFGAGEAGAFPGVARAFSHWIPYRQRGAAQGIFFVGAHIVGGLTPGLVMFMALYFSWRTIFVMFGLIGFAWAAAWYYWFRDDPAQHSQVNRAELQQIRGTEGPRAKGSAGPVPWRKLLLSRNMLALCLAYAPNSFVFYFCITWLPTFLAEKHGMKTLTLGFFAGLPLVLSIVPDVAGGLATDWAVGRFGPRWGRTAIGLFSNAVSGLGFLLAACTGNPWLAASLIALATAVNMFMLGAAWGTCQDIGGEHTGVVSAVMNTAAQLGSMICPIAVTYVEKQFNDWNAALFLIGAVFIVGAVCWCFVDPRCRISEVQC